MAFPVGFSGVSSFVTEPFFHGLALLETASKRRKVDFIRPDMPIEELGFVDVITHNILGILLLVPVINVVVLAILKCCSWSGITSSNQLEMKPFSKMIRYVPMEESVVSEEEYAKRKQYCLDEIKNISREEYRCSDVVLQFSLENILESYEKFHSPSRLLELCDSVGEDKEIKAILTQRLQFYNVGTNPCRMAAASNLSVLYDFFSRRLGSQEDREIWNFRFRGVVRELIDAHQNCTDQVNAQLEVIITREVGSFSAGQGAGIGPRDRLVQIAGFEILKYKANLITYICLQEYPGYVHQADLERSIKDRMAQSVGLQGTLFVGGAIINIERLDEKVDHVTEIFQFGASNRNNDLLILTEKELEYRKQNKFDPEKYLLENIRIHNGADEVLRSDLMVWAKSYFDFEATDPLTKQFLREISEDPNNTINEGGNLTPAATLYLLKTIGILVPRN